MKIKTLFVMLFISSLSLAATAGTQLRASARFTNASGAIITSAAIGSEVNVRITVRGAMNGTLGMAKLSIYGNQQMMQESFSSNGQISATCVDVGQQSIRSIDLLSELNPVTSLWISSVGTDDNVTTSAQASNPAAQEFYIDFKLRVYGGPTSCGLRSMTLNSLEVTDLTSGMNAPRQVLPLRKTLRVVGQ